MKGAEREYYTLKCLLNPVQIEDPIQNPQAHLRIQFDFLRHVSLWIGRERKKLESKHVPRLTITTYNAKKRDTG